MPPAPLPTRTPAPGSFNRRPGVGPCLGRGNHGDQRGAGVSPRIGTSGTLTPFVGRAAVYGCRVVDRDRREQGPRRCRERGRVEIDDRARAAAAAPHVAPETVSPDTEGRDDADSGDRNARNRRAGHLSIIPAAARGPYLRHSVDGDRNRKHARIRWMSE